MNMATESLEIVFINPPRNHWKKVLVFPEKNKSYGNYHKCQQEHEDGNAVDAMHIFHPLAVRCVRVTLFYVEIFCHLPEYAHLCLFYISKIRTLMNRIC